MIKGGQAVAADDIVEVGDVEVNVRAREIRRGGEVVAVPPRVLSLFVYLLEHRDRVVTKTELFEALWDGQAVVPDVLTTALYSLRRALGDRPKDPVYIRTVRRVGYRLVAEVKTRASSPTADMARLAGRFPALDARHAAFVGRDVQKHLFDEMLAGGSAVQLLFVHGPPGIGKTALLQELTYSCRQAGVQHVWLSGETVGPFVDGFVRALARALGCDSAFERVRDRLVARPLVIFVDDVHTLHGVDEWMRQELWPALPSFVRLVLAGRRAPSVRWRCDPAWHRGAHTVELPPMTVEEARALFSARGARTSRVDAMWSHTRGHPLALTLAADIVDGGEGGALEIFDHGGSIEALVGWFTDQTVAPMHQRAFEAACLFDHVSEPVLAALDDPSAAGERLRWLSTLSFVERVGETLRVHPLVREAVIARLGRSDPGRLADLVESGHRFFLDAFTDAPDPATKLRAVQHFMGLGRHHPAIRGNYAASDAGRECTVQPAAPRELACLLDLVRQYEGTESMGIVKRWLEHPATQVWSVSDELDVPAGFLVTVRLSLRDRHAAAGVGDPVVESILDFVEQSSGAQPEDEILIHRTLLARDDYQAPSIVTRHLHALKMFAFIWHGTHSPTVTNVFSVYGDPDVWEVAATHAGFVRLGRCEVDLAGRRFAPFHRSLREAPIEAWLGELRRRMVGAIREVASMPSGHPSERVGR